MHLLPEAFEIPLGTWVVMHEGIKTASRYRVVFDALVAGLASYVREKPRNRAG